MVMKKIQEFIGLSVPLRNALDVGCGTGMSTMALKHVAANIVGTDVSRAMLELAPVADAVHYIVSSAEHLSVGDGLFDMVTVSSSLHWFDRSLFLAEARRVLREEGWLVIYDNYLFRGSMRENPRFKEWNRDVYLRRYPSPPRDTRTLTGKDAAVVGFKHVGKEAYTNDVSFDRDGFVDYLVTQTNVTAAVCGESKSSKTFDHGSNASLISFSWAHEGPSSSQGVFCT